MPFSYHSHSGEFCCHGQDSLESIIQKSISVGYMKLGLSEHVPRFEAKDLYPEEKDVGCMELKNQFERYYSKANQFKSQYKKDIQILVGLETEYLSGDYVEQLTNYLTSVDHFEGVDYCVGSVHHVGGIPIDFDRNNFERALKVEEGNYQQLFEKYFDLQFHMLQYFQPEVVGHFDLIVLFTKKESMETLNWDRIQAKIIRNLNFINGYGGLIEINSRGINKLGQAYPTKRILQLLKENGAKFTLSDDAHAVHDVAKDYPKLKGYLVENGIKDLYYLNWYDQAEDMKKKVYGVKRRGRTQVEKVEGWVNLDFWNQF